MKIGPKYKIARRLGSPIFEKTQTQRFALSAERKGKTSRRPKQKSDFGLQLIEKQKARFFYGLTERQFKNYVKTALEKNTDHPTQELFSALESRLDNAVWRLGLARTHLAARQMTAHGHITVNGRRAYTPSYKLSEGDVLAIREGSKKSPLFNKEVDVENPEKTVAPSWIAFDASAKVATVKSHPKQQENELLFDLGKVIEFYQR